MQTAIAIKSQTMTTSKALHAVPAIRSQPVSRVNTRCSTCNLRELCLPCGLNDGNELLDELVYTRKRVKRGEVLFHAGATFESLYAVRSGFFKSNVLLEDGREQGTAFHMAGEVLGLDGIGTDSHVGPAPAFELRQLETSQRLRDHARAVATAEQNPHPGRVLGPNPVARIRLISRRPPPLGG